MVFNRALLVSLLSDARPVAECWEWPGPTNERGYGRVSIGHERRQYAHRIAWELAHGPIPDGMTVCHHCDNPPCYNPAHLFIGSQADNMADKVAKNRQRRGESNCAKLTEQNVRQILELRGIVSQKALGVRFGVSAGAIQQIHERKSWRHIS